MSLRFAGFRREIFSQHFATETLLRCRTIQQTTDQEPRYPTPTNYPRHFICSRVTSYPTPKIVWPIYWATISWRMVLLPLARGFEDFNNHAKTISESAGPVTSRITRVEQTVNALVVKMALSPDMEQNVSAICKIETNAASARVPWPGVLLTTTEIRDVDLKNRPSQQCLCTSTTTLTKSVESGRSFSPLSVSNNTPFTLFHLQAQIPNPTWRTYVTWVSTHQHGGFCYCC